ncbi:HNH endonuclease signature motif containing protein [Mycobacterium sp. GA-1285]|uniref:HNH endonuclease signature motif containing protein n=1 Tax=Mycobacterium sp. GA-1285 TaxID=1772282 RepID=UPI00155F94DC|nr:HNH endonuclease signature motif containing protein [Mycobacterium sp. GA-1285]
MSITDGELLERRIAQVSSRLCHDDPRSAGQRRSEALGAIAANAEALSCRCGRPDCPSAGVDDARAAHFVINVIAEAAALTTPPESAAVAPAQSAAAPAAQSESAAAASAASAPEAESAERPESAAASGESAAVSAPSAQPKPKPKPAAALIVGGGVIPTPLLAELIRNGAKVAWVDKPAPAPQTGYRPSPAMARFVRMRDMTCRFPGCARPAQFCDLDHTTPYRPGVTHPSNIKCLCRLHHLVKTFGGWGDQQHPDGTDLRSD